MTASDGSWFPLAAAAALGVVALLRRSAGGYDHRSRRLAFTALHAGALALLAAVAGGILHDRPAGTGRLVALVERSFARTAKAGDEVDVLLGELRRQVPAGTAFSVLEFSRGGTASDEPASDAPAAAFAGPEGLEAALRDAVGMLEPGVENRVLLVGDAGFGGDQPLRAAASLRGAGARVLAWDLAGSRRREVRVKGVNAPVRVIPGEKFEISALVEGRGEGALTAELFRDGKSVAARQVSLEGEAGERVAGFLQVAGAPGISRFRLVLGAVGETPFAGLDQEFDVRTEEYPDVTLVSDEPAESAGLIRLLERSGFAPRLVEPEALSRDAGAEGPRRVVILDGVEARRLGSDGMERLEAAVRREGVGLLAVGGPRTLGSGDFAQTPLEQALPVVMGAPPGGADTGIGLAVVLDASLSMVFRGRLGGGFHNARAPNKIDVAKSAVIELVRAMRPGDEFGLIESNDLITWRVELGPIASPAAIEERVRRIQAIGGGINFYSSVDHAYAALRKSRLPLRMVMVISDADDIDQHRVEGVGDSAALVRRMAEEGITLSIFSIGSPSDKDVAFLRRMTALGRGEFYLVSSLQTLPRYLRAEFGKKTGEQIREEPFQPVVRNLSPALRGLDLQRLPTVRALNVLTAKQGAEEILSAPFASPLLVSWSYGRGRTGVFAADSGFRWAPDWLTWPDAEGFWRQLIFSLAARPAPPPFEASGTHDGTQLVWRVRRNGRPLPEGAVLDAALEWQGGARNLRLERRGVDTFRTPLPEGVAGTVRYALFLGGDPGSGTGGTVVLRPALRTRAEGVAVADQLVRETGGAWVRDAAGVLAALPPARPRDRTVVFWALFGALVLLFGARYRRE